MALELHENATDSKGATPYLLNIQHDLCRTLTTRIVVPVVFEPPVNSNTDFVLTMTIGEMSLYAIIPHLAAVPVSALGEFVADCSSHYDTIRDRVDRLFIGF